MSELLAESLSLYLQGAGMAWYAAVIVTTFRFGEYLDAR